MDFLLYICCIEKQKYACLSHDARSIDTSWRWRWRAGLHGVGAQVIMALVHMHEGLVRFPAVAGLVESGPPDVELQGGSSIAVAAVSKDRLNDDRS